MSNRFWEHLHPHPIEGMRLFINIMMHYGISKKEIEIMTKINPARLLELS